VITLTTYLVIWAVIAIAGTIFAVLIGGHPIASALGSLLIGCFWPVIVPFLALIGGLALLAVGVKKLIAQ